MGNNERIDQNEIKLRILLIIEKNGSVDDLYNLGYKYFQITKLLKEELEIGNAKLSDGQLQITEKGIKAKNDLLKILNMEKLDKFVLPKLSSQKIDKIHMEDIFIPSEDELPF